MTDAGPRGLAPVPSSAVLVLDGVSVRRDGRAILDDVDWVVRPGERWVVLGRNGSGKTTLVRVASMALHPSEGSVDLLGERLGRTDVRLLRQRVGVVSASLAAQHSPHPAMSPPRILDSAFHMHLVATTRSSDAYRRTCESHRHQGGNYPLL